MKPGDLVVIPGRCIVINYNIIPLSESEPPYKGAYIIMPTTLMIVLSHDKHIYKIYHDGNILSFRTERMPPKKVASVGI